MYTVKPLLLLTTLALSSLPAALSAQSLPGGMTGTVELEYTTDGNSDFTLLYGDVDASFPISGGDRGLGLDVGLTGYLGESSFNEIAVFAALTYTTGVGKFSFGLPRNASAGISRMPVIGGTQLVGLAQDAFVGDLPLARYLIADDPFLGMRYDGDYGALKAALSLHHFDSGADVADLAVKYDGGFFFTSGSLQHFSSTGSGDATVLHGEIGAATEFYEAGIGATSGDSLIPDAWQAWASYRPMDKLGVSATVLDPDGANTIFGLSAKYGFSQSGYVQAGISDTRNADALWDLSVGLDF